jgi:hypothetical protein
MHRIYLLAFVFILLFMTCASAEIYSCRTSDGELVMTDQKSNFPADCQPVDEPMGKGGFNIVPSTTADEVESPPALPEQASTPDVPDGQDVILEVDRDRAPLVRREHRKERHSDLPGSAVTPEHHPERMEPMHKSPKK